MTAHPRAFRAAEQLAAILEAADLPPRVRAVGERVRARLSSPVRIAVIGQAGSGKGRVVNGLLGSEVLPDLPGLPPSEVSLGAGRALRAVMADGWERPLSREDLARVDPFDLAYLRFEAPLPILEKLSLIVVPLEGGGEDVAAALSWASARADMVLWCTPDLDGADAGLWPGLPERLQDHAFLAVTGAGGHGASRAARDHAACFFREMRSLAPGPGGGDRVAALRAALMSHVSLALREDLEGAILFLDQYVSHEMCTQLPGRRALPALAAPIVPPVPVQILEPVERPSAEEEGGPDTNALPLLLENPIAPGAPDAGGAAPIVAEVPLHLRIVGLLQTCATALLPLCEETEEDGIVRSARMVLDHCTDTLEACAQLAQEPAGWNPTTEDAGQGIGTGADAAALSDLLAEASDIMLLMRLEGSPTAVADAIALMLQVRRECEVAAAA